MLNEDVEEMPIHHSKENLTREEIEIIRAYRRNDVKVTEKLFQLTLGNVDIPELKDYKGKNKIQDRFDVMQETGLQCLNWSDVKIGEEWNKLDYMKEENISDPRDLFPKKVKHPYGQKFKNFFPKHMEFQTDQLKDFVKKLGNEYVKNTKQEFPIKIGNTTYTIAKGGLHSTEKHRHITIPKGFRYDDEDIGSQYPNSMVKFEICPPHLKKTFLHQYKGKISKRISYKKIAKDLIKENQKEKARPLMSVQEMLKLCLNGGGYGKLGQRGSFLEFPEGMLRVTMGNQMEILMLIERLEMSGFQVLSGNTDGISVYYPETKRQEFLEICEWWEKKVGNFEMGKLEETPFKEVWQESINHYIAKKEDGVKKKGRFATEFELHKNKSKRIIPMALEAYFIDKKDPAEFIRNHKNIYDFCIAKKAAGKMYYEEQWQEDGVTKTKTHKKLVRYFISTNGTVLYKRGFNNQGDPVNNHCEAETDIGQPLITYFNRFFESDDYKIDYNYYILETLERIDSIEKTRKAKAFVDSIKAEKGGNQLSLF